MQLKRIRRRLQKRVQTHQQQIEDLGSFTEKSLERNVFRRFERLLKVRRFVFGWILLMVLVIGCLIAQLGQLSNYYQRTEAVPGGIYSEGTIGSISNINPVYATSDVDRSLSRLVFAGLLTHDANGQLIPELARSYTVSDNGKVYTVTLKHGLTWQDGQPLTAADVVFTYNIIKNPDAQSPLFASWQNVGVTAPNSDTVVFTLPSTLASFPSNLTTGIIPQHLLTKVSVANLRAADFNTVSPIGAGPFLWHGLQVNGNDPSRLEEQVALLPFAGYVGGKPKLNEFILRAYASSDRLQHAFASGQLTAASGLYATPKGTPKGTQTHNLLLAAGTYVFFKTSTPPLNDAVVRQALVAASAPNDIISRLGFMTRPVTEPLLQGQLGYNASYAQKTNNVAAAEQALTGDGWLRGKDGRLVKNGVPLRFDLVATDTPEYRLVTSQLQKQWRALGVKVSVQLLSPSDYTTTLAGHDYDATLYGISIGSDPDVYAYWDSSQADVRSANRLNLSEWKNTTADTALEAGRTRLDPQLRTIKYAPFLQAWQQDAPALGLYQPTYLYVTRQTVYGLTDHSIASSIDRFNGVQNWEVRTARVTIN